MLTGGDLHEDLLNMPNYKEYIRNSFVKINTYFAKDFNLDNDVLGQMRFEGDMLGVVIAIHKNSQSLREIQTILNIILYLLDVDYIVRFPLSLLECSLKDLKISFLSFFPIPLPEHYYLYLLKIKMINKESLTFQVNSPTLPEDTYNINFAFNILYHLVPNITKYTEVKPKPTWLIPNTLQYYLMPEEEITDELEMACDYKYHKIVEFINTAFSKWNKNNV